MEADMADVDQDQGSQVSPSSLSDGTSSKDELPLLKTNVEAVTANDKDLELKFAPFVRNDVYGPMGYGELPLVEKVLLGIAIVTVVPLRVAISMTIILLFYVICKICTIFSTPNRDELEEQEDFAHLTGWRRLVMVQCGRFLSRVLLFVLGFFRIKKIRKGREQIKRESTACDVNSLSEDSGCPGAIISNHTSYIDVLYHMSSSFPSFVAKRSVAKLPLVGLISKCLGCVYVQRELKSPDFKGVSGIVTERVKEAHLNASAPIMMMFPEGTTTNGQFLLPFKTGAFLARAPVLPVILRYPYQRFSLAWDSISGLRHMFFLLCQFVNHMEVIQLPIYYPSKEEKDDARLYALNIREMMAREGGLLTSELGLAEKRIYLAALNGKGNIWPTVLHEKED